MFFEQFFLLWQWQHTRQIGWQRAAQRTAKGQRLQSVTANGRVRGKERVSISPRMRERARQSREQESAAPVWNSGASYDANGRAKQSSKQGTHRPYAEGGKSAAEGRERVRVREQNLHRAAANTHTHIHTHMQMLIVLKRGENEMQRNEWAAQNVRNKMEAGTWK